MKIIKKAIGKKYRFICDGCGTLLEATKEDFTDEGLYAVFIDCPVCNMNRIVYHNDMEEIIIYEGEEET